MGPKTAELQLHTGFCAVVTKARSGKGALPLERAFQVMEDRGMKRKFRDRRGYQFSPIA